MAKQIFLDLLIVIAIPGLLVYGYYFIKSDEGIAVLSSASPATVARPGQEGVELGAKTKAALVELNSIKFDESIFSDPTFLSLEDFTEEINPSPIGRDYPFVSPDELRNMVKRNSIKKNITTPNYSTKLNMIKEINDVKK